MNRPEDAASRLADHPDLARLQARSPSPLADLVGRVLHPAWVLLVGSLMTVGWSLRPHWGTALAWEATVVTCCVVAPLGVLRLAVHRGWVSDPQVVRREERLLPLALVAGVQAVGVALLVAAGAPRVCLALVAGVLCSVTAFGLVSLRSKISFHVGALAGMLAVLTQVLGAAACLMGVPALALLGWARWRAGRHSVSQLVVGAAAGALVCGGVFRLLG